MGRIEYKQISRESIPAALKRAEKYRNLNQPEQAESIARDVLLVEPNHPEALRVLSLAITDLFPAQPERFAEAEEIIGRLADPYERMYLSGLCHERLCRALLHKGSEAATLSGLAAAALRYYGEAEALRPPGNDEALLRWNSILRLIEKHPQLAPPDEGEEEMDYGDSPPLCDLP